MSIPSLPSGASILTGPTRIDLPAAGPSVFTGCFNHWGRNCYWQSGAWSVEIDQVRSTSTCGSPVFAGAKWWAGFLREGPGGVSCDGKKVSFNVPAGQELLVFDPAPYDESAWRIYLEQAEHRLVERPAPVARPAHWTAWEYCTWVEQKAAATPAQEGRDPINEKLVRELAERVLRLGLPPGKFTIDDGWQQHAPSGFWNDGYWRIDPRKFPDLPGLCAWLKARGFTPGLWFGLPLLPAKAALRTDRPELFGSLDHVVNAETNLDNSPWSLASGPVTEAYVRETLRPYVEMGFRKFKFDFYYGVRTRMNALARTVHRAVRSLDPTIEIESHHPDFFFSRWIDTCRLNDVLVQTSLDWEGLTLAHMRVARLCAPDRVMNLDHLGGNNQHVSEADYLRHLEILALAPRDQARYPVVSLLPDRYSAKACQRVREFVLQHSSAGSA